ncbi:capreomycidine synthase [Saccharopolyspora gregorii]|uniref:capreomycidine synthase n=1 Tax=Saccharopolyspora gregorii TaxID=33914 RepID=UPI0021ACB898|nr:capreomycidine synthase [Saccharopolyspora gregorii]
MRATRLPDQVPANSAPLLEEWYRRHLRPGVLDLSSSGVRPYTFEQVRLACGIGRAELDAVLMDDSDSQGGADVRRAIADRYGDGDPDRVLVTHGSSEAIALTLPVVLRPGDRVVVQESAYHALGHYPAAIGCEVAVLPTGAVRGGHVDPAVLAELITGDVAAVIVNFPHNPTGRTLSPEGWAAFVDHVATTGALLVWDAAFSEITHRWAQLPEPASRYERTLSYGTFSKAFGLPGLRVGWCLGPPELLRATFPRRDRSTLFLSPLVELIAARAMRRAPALIEPRRAEARRNLDRLRAWVAEHAEHVRWQEPLGGVCALLEIRGLSGEAADCEAFCLGLLEAHRTLLVPGSAFGRPDGVRLGFGGAEREFRAGLGELSAWLRGARS